MYGQNQVTKPFRSAGGTLLVNSVFGTIQGEGPDSGTPAIFVRLAKCNLRCWFCDTEFETGQYLSAEELLQRVMEKRGFQRTELIVITGGEPLLQDITPFCQLAGKRGFRVSVETAGTTYYEELETVFGPGSLHKIICSPKTPVVHPKIVPLVRAWKYVVRFWGVCTFDGLPIGSTQRPDQAHSVKVRLFRPPRNHPAPIYVQPVDEGNEEKNRANLRQAVASTIAHGYRLSVQIHKIAGLP